MVKNSAIEVPYYARRDSGGSYRYHGIPLQSVTTKLGYAPGQHLIPWSGKEAALDCIGFLIAAGTPTDDPVILESCASQLGKHMSMEQAVAHIMDWKVRMLAHERYRDHKARIGSLGHHWVYKCALKIDGASPEMAPDRDLMMEWLRHEAIKLNLFVPKNNPDYLPTIKELEDLCAAAYSYTVSSSEWILKANPTWTTVGQEAMVVHIPVTIDHELFEEILLRRCGLTRAQFDKLPETMQRWCLEVCETGYAGTVDAHFSLDRSTYKYDWPSAWGKDSVSLWCDFKHSNAINHKAVQAQVSAYEACDRIVLIESGEEYDLPPSDFIASLHIGPHASALGLETEFGTLESKAKQLGAALYTYPRSEAPIRGFRGLCQWVDYADNVPKAHQQRQLGVPKKETTPKTAVRPAPFG